MKKHTATVLVFNNHTSRLCTCSTVSEEQAAVSEAAVSKAAVREEQAAVSKAAVSEEQAAVSWAAGLAWGDSQHRLLALCAYGMRTGTRGGWDEGWGGRGVEGRGVGGTRGGGGEKKRSKRVA